MTVSKLVMDSPIGQLELLADDESLVSVGFGGEGQDPAVTDHRVLLEAKHQLQEYFNGERKAFDLPIKIEGTQFQQEVWKELCEIPYGTTCSYGEIAARINRPKAVRAIGQANKANKFPVIIPCHRVIGKDKTMTGYAGKQVDKKEILLSLEQGL